MYIVKKFQMTNYEKNELYAADYLNRKENGRTRVFLKSEP